MGRHVPGSAAGEVRRTPGPELHPCQRHPLAESRLVNQEVTLLAAFAAGVLSFVSPCVLPLIPGYISFVSGVSVEEMRADIAPATSRLQVFLTSLAFVLGFSLVFI